MNNTFTYAIDERKLRVQLRAMESTPCNEAWSRFESYADANPFKVARKPFGGIQVKLDRNIVLPALFAVVICLFSLLLLNFVTIKNPKEQDDHKAELSPVVTENALTEIEESVPVRSAPAVVAEKVPAEQTSAKPAVIQTGEGSVSSAVDATEISADQTVQPVVNEAVQEQVAEQAVKRRSKKQASLVEQIRPTTFTDDDDPEVLPN